MALASDKYSQINQIFERTTVVVEPQDELLDLSKWEIELTGKYDNNDYKGLVDCIHKFIECIITNVSSKIYPQQILISRKCFSLLKDIVKGDWRYLFVNNITKLIFDIIIEKDAEYWCAKKQLLKIFNNWIEETKKVTRREAVKHLSKIYLLKMVGSLSSYGDYDLQVSIIETIFRMYGKKELCAKLKELTPESETISQTFAEINLETFDEDCRTFLNYFNQKNKNIFSIVCESVLIAGIACEPPMEDVGGLWVDFNICNKAVSWYLKTTDLDNSEQVEQWELITLFASDLENTYIKRKTDAVTICFHLKLSGHLISSFEENEQLLNQATNVLIILKRNEETEKLLTGVLPKMLGKPQEICSTAKNIKVSILSLMSQSKSEVSSTYSLNPTSNQPITSENSSNKDRPTNLDSISSTEDPNKNLPDKDNDFSNQTSKNIQILSRRCDGSSFNYRQINSIKSLSTPEQNTRNSMKVSKNQGTNSSSVKWKTAVLKPSNNPKLNKEQSKYNSSEKENINKASTIKYDDVQLDYLSLKVSIGNKNSGESEEIKEKLPSLDHSMDFAEEIISSNHAINVSEVKTTSINQEAATKKTDFPENIPKEVYNEILENDIIKVLNKVGAEYETSKHHKDIGSLEQDKMTENAEKENHDPQTQTTKKYSEPNADVHFDILIDPQNALSGPFNTKIENTRLTKKLVPKRTDKINTILIEKVKQNLIQSQSKDLYKASTRSITIKNVKKYRKRVASNKEFDNESVRPIKSMKLQNNLVLNKELVIVLNRIEEPQKVENKIRDQNGNIIGDIYDQNHPAIKTKVEKMVGKPSITSNQGPSTEKRKKLHRKLHNPNQITEISRDEVDTKLDTWIVTKKTFRSSEAIEKTSKLSEVISKKGIEKVLVDEITSAVEDEIRAVPENFSEFEESLAENSDSVKNSTKTKRHIKEIGNKKIAKENVKSKSNRPELISKKRTEKVLVDEITSANEEEISDSVKNSTKNKRDIKEIGNKKTAKENVKSKSNLPEAISEKRTEKALVDEITSANEEEIRVVPKNFSEFEESLAGKSDSVKNSTKTKRDIKEIGNKKTPKENVKSKSNRPEAISEKRTEKVLVDDSVKNSTKNKIDIKEKGNKKSKSCSFQTNTTKHANLGRNRKNVTSTEEKHRKYIKLNATISAKRGPKTSFEQTLDSWREMAAEGKSLLEYINNRKKRITNRNRTVSAETEEKENSPSKKTTVRRKRITKKKFALDVSGIKPIKLEKCNPVSNTPILEETNTVNKQIAISKDAFKKKPQPNQIVEENVSFGNQSLLEKTTKKITGGTNLKVNEDKIVIISDIPLVPLPKRAKIQEVIEDEFTVPTTQINNIEEPEVDQIIHSEFYQPEKRHANLPHHAECLVLQSAPSWAGTALLNDTIVTIKSSDFIGKYLVLFFYPFDFACMPYAEPPSEILSINENYEEFIQLNTEVVGCSVDFCCTHRAWLNNNLDMQNESRRLKFPLLADIDHEISQAFMIYSERLCHSYRGFYIIDPEGIIIAIDLVDLRCPIFIDEILLRIRGHTSR